MRSFNFLAMSIVVFSAIVLAACASSPKIDDESLSAHQICLLKEQNEKKKIYEELPALLKLVSGDSQIISEYGSFPGALPIKPTSKDLNRLIASFPEDQRHIGSWGTSKQPRAFTVSGYIVRKSELSEADSGRNVSLFRISIGQPGRTYSIPLDAFRKEGDGLVADINGTYKVTPSSGLPSERTPYSAQVRAKMVVRPIDKRHVLILVEDKSAGNSVLNLSKKHALLVRTYTHQDFDTKDLWQDWPVYAEGENQSSCD